MIKISIQTLLFKILLKKFHCRSINMNMKENWNYKIDDSNKDIGLWVEGTINIRDKIDEKVKKRDTKRIK